MAKMNLLLEKTTTTTVNSKCMQNALFLSKMDKRNAVMKLFKSCTSLKLIDENEIFYTTYAPVSAIYMYYLEWEQNEISFTFKERIRNY